MKTNAAELIKIHSGKFNYTRVKALKNGIAHLFNEYTRRAEPYTILVVVQFKGGSQKQFWAEIPIRKLDEITHIAFYKVKQVPTFIKN